MITLEAVRQVMACFLFGGAVGGAVEHLRDPDKKMYLLTVQVLICAGAYLMSAPALIAISLGVASGIAVTVVRIVRH